MPDVQPVQRKAVETAGMRRICPQCHATWPVTTSRCPSDGAPLDNAEVTLSPEGEVSLSISLAGNEVHQVVDFGLDEELAVGAVIGDFEVLKKLGAGGGGVVYAARHRVIGKKAAIKVIHGSLSADRTATERFLDEARTVNAIGHPSVVDIFAMDRLPDGRPYLVMEWLHGTTLTTHLRENTLDARAKLQLVEQICVALEAAHAKGVVHSDLKPDNIFVLAAEGPPRIKLLDFGIATLVGDDRGHAPAATGVVLGTPAYMSPEQVCGLRVSTQSDVYSLGVVMYRLFAGRPPFIASTPVALLMEHVQKSPPPPQTLSPKVPTRLAPVMLQMLAKDPRSRPSLASLRAVVRESLFRGTVLPTQAPLATGPTERRTSWLFIVVSLLVVIGAGVGFEYLRQQDPEPAPAAPAPPPPPPKPPPAPERALLELHLEPPSAEAKLDGVELRLVAGHAKVPLEPNRTYRFAVDAPGYIVNRQELSFEPGEHRELTINLLKLPVESPAGPAPRASAPTPKKPPAKPAHSKDDGLLDPF